MTKDQLQKACDLLGGHTATANLLNLKTSRYLRKVLNEQAPIPEGWGIELRQAMAHRIQEMNRLIRELK